MRPNTVFPTAELNSFFLNNSFMYNEGSVSTVGKEARWNHGGRKGVGVAIGTGDFTGLSIHSRAISSQCN